MKIHIGLVVQSMHVGGLERCVTRLANGLDRDRFQLSVICLDRTGPAADWIKNPDVSVVELRRKQGNSAALVGQLADRLKQLRIDIVHSHNWGTLLESHLAVRWARRGAARPAGRILHVHAERGTVLGPPSRNSWHKRARALVMRWIVARADATMCNAYSIADKIRDITKLRNHPITVIPNGLDVPYSAEALEQMRCAQRAQLGLGPSDILIGSIGRIVPVKNFALALSSFARVNPGGDSKLHFLLVGDGPGRTELEQLASDLGVASRVHFPGEQGDVWPYYAALDLYLNTSHSEGMSQSILEAMAAGLPVLASDVGDSKRLIRGAEPCGDVVPSPTTDSFSAQLQAILSDREQLRRYAANSQAVYRANYTLEAMLKSFESFYLQLWSSARPMKFDGSVA
ncbi:MAG: glycosyltransferase [Aureliella sp.]